MRWSLLRENFPLFICTYLELPCLFNKQLHELLFIKQIMFNIFHRTLPCTLSLPSSLSSKAQLHIFIQFFQLFSAIYPVVFQYIHPVLLVFSALKQLFPKPRTWIVLFSLDSVFVMESFTLSRYASYSASCVMVSCKDWDTSSIN